MGSLLQLRHRTTTLGPLGSPPIYSSLLTLIQAIREVYAEQRRERVAEWKAWVDAYVDLPDRRDLDAMLPESAGSMIAYH